MAHMFGPRVTTVFRSKWRALWWAVSVLVGVWFSVPHGQDRPDPGAQKDAEALAGLFGHPATPAKHVNPWAKTPQ
jgi:hypothetical protein